MHFWLSDTLILLKNKLESISRYANEEQQKQRQFRGWKAAIVINQLEDDDEEKRSLKYAKNLRWHLYIWNNLSVFFDTFKTQRFFIFKLLWWIFLGKKIQVELREEFFFRILLLIKKELGTCFLKLSWEFDDEKTGNPFLNT